jgi:phosphatidate phosphatase LPIN
MSIVGRVSFINKALWPVVNAVTAVGTFYTELNPATLSGAIDIVVVEQESGEVVCSPFHVRFGKLKLLRPSDKVVREN